MPEQNVLINIEDEMRAAYLDYAMSVIVGRALPDVRDGLKPVHRRVLFGMNEMGLAWNRAYKKSARVVGDVMGKYHPHGDAAIYDTIVRMAQDFSLRYPLVDGQGNFGSVDGDPPAAMRYTEVRMAQIGHELLADIDKETVDFGPNYDDTQTEPLVLPTRLPNLLVNGAAGIAVGMATNIPPHNLGEVVDGVLLLLDNPAVTIDELMGVIKGPDFPTAGFIYGSRGIGEAYRTGRGSLTLRARVRIETHPRTDKESLIVTELPYQVNKAKLLEKIAELVSERRIEGIADLRDESDREGMRVVIELKRGEIASVILNQLFKHTPLQTTFGIITLALVRNQPQILNLHGLLSHFIEHRREVVVRRTRYELRKAEEKAHILEGLKKAIDHLDAVIALIRAASDPEAAKTGLMTRFALSAIQAQAILDMRLQRLTNLEREKLVTEYQETLQKIESLKAILASDALVRGIIREELTELKTKYGDERRTEIVEESAEISLEDLIAPEDVIITVSHSGYIKRNPVSLYRAQRRGGKGKIGMGTKEEDFVTTLFTASTKDYLLFFTSSGKVYWLKVHQVPEAGRVAKGKPIINLLQLGERETVSAILPVSEFRGDRFVVMATKHGTVKKTELSAHSNPRAGGIIALGLEEGDQLVSALVTNGDEEVLLGTKKGLVIRFPEANVRPMGRTAYGVKGIELEPGDEVISMEVVHRREAATLLTVTEHGYGKRTDLAEYRSQSRGGKGIITIQTTARNGDVVAVLQVAPEDDVMLVTAGAQVLRLAVATLRVIGRNTQGVRLIEMAQGDRVAAAAIMREKDEAPSGSSDLGPEPEAPPKA
ncbi:MAG: DNA gyrase subunit A [Nitrospirota bacterium]